MWHLMHATKLPAQLPKCFDADSSTTLVPESCHVVESSAPQGSVSADIRRLWAIGRNGGSLPEKLVQFEPCAPEDGGGHRALIWRPGTPACTLWLTQRQAAPSTQTALPDVMTLPELSLSVSTFLDGVAVLAPACLEPRVSRLRL